MEQTTHQNGVRAGDEVPSISFPSTTSADVNIGGIAGWIVIFLYPRSSSPTEEAPLGLANIPGAKGCTPQASSFKDFHEQLQHAGVSGVFGLSTQSSAYQQELAQRLHLNYPLLSDPQCRLADGLGLRTFKVAGEVFYVRTTLVIRNGVVQKVFDEIEDPGANALEVLAWLSSRLTSSASRI